MENIQITYLTESDIIHYNEEKPKEVMTMKLVCELCGGVLLVTADGQQAECTQCGLRYSMASLREKLNKKEQPESPKPVEPEQEEVSDFARPYKVWLERARNSACSRYNIMVILGGRPRPLSNECTLYWDTTDKHFELPICVSRGMKKVFEGVLTGVPDGKTLSITLDIDPAQTMPVVIKETSNSTVHFQERPGATDNWAHGQRK